MNIKNFARSLLLIVAAVVAPFGVVHADPNQGPGGPILVVTNGNQNFGKFYAEILRTEGFNEFAVADIGSVTATTLNSYDVVILAKVAVTSTQASMFSTWVTAGGNLIAMDPAPQLAGLLGITSGSTTLANGYLLVDNSTKAGAGIVATTLQFHGTAQLSTLAGATSIASLYTSATVATANPAVTIRNVGSNGGQAAAFMFDLATSIVYTRQGNPAWVSQERDGQTPRRSDDMFFGDSASDPQPDWIDKNKIAIPQADEQQRFLANLITDMNADRKPLPRFWYLPNSHRAVVVMTGDDHGFTAVSPTGGGTNERFNQFLTLSAPGCSLANWECIRGTSYVFSSGSLTDAQAGAFNAQGFEIGLHVNPSDGSGVCQDYTQSSLTDLYADQKATFFNKFSSITTLSTMRHHCIVWSDWASGAKVQLANGIRLDTSYYYWPGDWVDDVPGHFTGSAMPMRFADLDGTLIDVYQAVTQMTDESQQSYPFTPNTLLDRAVGADEQYGVYTVNAHTDLGVEPESTLTIQSAKDRSVPVITARQMLTWLDGRGNSSFGSLSFATNVLSFSITQAPGANGLNGMLPWRSGSRFLSTVTRSGTDVPYEVMVVKGVEYAVFPASTGAYAASYIVDNVPPTVAARNPAPGGTGILPTALISATFNESIDSTTITTGTFEVRDATNAVVSGTVAYGAGSLTATFTPSSALASGATYTVTLRGGSTDPRVKDTAGNALVANVSWQFTTAAPPTCPCTIFGAAASPANPSESDPGSVELGVKFRSDLNGYIKGIRFYKGTSNTGTHTGTLWTASGTVLAQATFVNETATGWQQVLFSTPVAISANTVYVASYHAPAGGYASTVSQFASAGVDNGALHALSAPAAGGNGVYSYSSAVSFPASSFNDTNYWVDVVFDTNAGTTADTSPPVVTISTPVATPTYATTGTPLSIGGTASDNVGVSQVTWANDRGGAGTAVGTSSWTASGIVLLSGDNLITVTARDAANNSSTDTITVTYTVVADTTPPTVNSRVPASGATLVPIDSVVTIGFNEAMSAASVSSSSIELRNASNALVAATVNYNATSNVATLTPASSLATSAIYTVVVRGGATDPRVKDLAGNALAANDSWSFTTAGSLAQPISLWTNTTTPVTASDSDTVPIELGLKFRADTAGVVTGVRFYKGPTNTGTHVGKLWSSTGSLLGQVTFGSETATGWQQALFSSPIAIAANTTYVVSYYAPNGGYASNSNYFASAGFDNGVLHAPSDADAAGNGLYAYASGGGFPNSSFASSNYWVDVVYQAASGPDTTPPTITQRIPATGATNVAINGAVAITFSEAMTAATISTSTIELRNAANTLVPATVNYSGNVATLTPTGALANSAVYTVTVRGGATDPRVKDAAGNALIANDVWSFTTAAVGGPCAANTITAENCLTGNPSSEWDITGAGDTSIQGFATQISVNRGSTVDFKVNTTSANYRLDIYRMGYYGGLGARKITTVTPTLTLPLGQDPCMTQPASGLIDCGNWKVTASWTVPANATSGIYFAKVVRADTGGASHIMFIVRNDASTSDIVFQTSDTTWQAYNAWGGNSLYVGSPGANPGRAYKVSYNRPFATRGDAGGQDWVFNAEYPMIRWLESNGYDVTYITGVDTDRAASLLAGHRLFMSTGHDEYWSGQQRANVEAARDAGLNLAFFSGNEVFWKTRWENSIDGSGTAYRTLVSYKETHANSKLDTSSPVWTGTWRDPRFSPPSDGGRPENTLTGTVFTVNSGTAGITIPAAEGKLRLWRGTAAANLTGTNTLGLPSGVLGYEWDSDLDNGSRPAGLFRLSDTTVSGVDKLQDYGSTYATDTSNHALTMYKAASGARVFGAGTVQWSWGLDANHDRAGTPVSQVMQQATVNLFADMNVQPANLQAGLSAASATTDTTAPTVVITTPAAGASLPQSSIAITGTASDAGGQVAGVEVSTDGATWHPATGRGSWTYTWTAPTSGAATIRVRAVDDSGNLQSAPTTVSITVGSTTCPCTIWTSQTPDLSPDVDPASVELGTRFRTSTAGIVTALRFYKISQNTGTHVGSLWSATGALLAQVTFAGESGSGWQVQALSSAVSLTPNTDYVVSYHTNSGNYTGQDGYFASSGVSNGPLVAPQDGSGGSNGLYKYSANSAFPTDTYSSEGYWVDVVFNTSGSSDTTLPVVTISTPTTATTTTVTTTPFSLGGTASDNVGVTQVTWTNNRGGSGTATGTSTWSVSGVTLLSGANVITVTARDAAGNTSTDSLTVTYNAPDITAPVVTITSPTSATTATASSTPYSLGGTASDAVGVTQVTWVNSRGGSGTASGTTSWSVTGIVLLSGSNVLTVTARDAAGNTNTDTLTVTYTPDTTAPVVTITGPTSNATTTVTASTMALSGTASDAVGVTQVTWVNSRGGSGTATGTTSWSVASVTLLSGSNVLTVTARDAAGNTSTDTLTVTYNPDTTLPVVTITGPTSNTTTTVTASPLAISGTASDNIGVTQVTWANSRGGSGTAMGTTSWSVASITLQSGSNVLTVTARDAAGNTSTDTLTVTYLPDTTLPNVTITGPTSNSTLTVTASPLALSGTASDNIGVTSVTWTNSRGGSGTATGTTSWSVPSITLVSGSNVITVTARDAAGNTRTDTLTVTYNPDTTLPNITITSPTSNATTTTTAASMVLGGTASDNVAVTQVTWTNSRGGSGTATGTTSWSTGSVALLTGSNVLTVRARDAAGNTRTDTLTVTRN